MEGRDEGRNRTRSEIPRGQDKGKENTKSTEEEKLPVEDDHVMTKKELKKKFLENKEKKLKRIEAEKKRIEEEKKRKESENMEEKETRNLIDDKKMSDSEKKMIAEIEKKWIKISKGNKMKESEVIEEQEKKITKQSEKKPKKKKRKEKIPEEQEQDGKNEESKMLMNKPETMESPGFNYNQVNSATGGTQLFDYLAPISRERIHAEKLTSRMDFSQAADRVKQPIHQPKPAIPQFTVSKAEHNALCKEELKVKEKKRKKLEKTEKKKNSKTKEKAVKKSELVDEDLMNLARNFLHLKTCQDVERDYNKSSD